MKNVKQLFLICCVSFLSTGYAFSQTNVIAVKSHAGKYQDRFQQNDNFGIHPSFANKSVDSVKLFRAEKMYVEYSSTHTDTILQSHLSDSMLLESVKYIGIYYPTTTKLINFPTEIEFDQRVKMDKMQKNAFASWIFPVMLLLMTGTIYYRKKSLHA